MNEVRQQGNLIEDSNVQQRVQLKYNWRKVERNRIIIVMVDVRRRLMCEWYHR